MLPRRFARHALVAVLCSAAIPAKAALFRAYLAADGSDAGPCTLTQPCRLLPAALGNVADGGEIWMLDSANYNTGPVMITKSVTIMAVPGILGSLVAAQGAALNVSGGVRVALRNLVFVPLQGASGTYAVILAGPARLSIEQSVFANFTYEAVMATGPANLSVSDSLFRNNAGYALWVRDGAQAEVSRSQFVANSSGIVVSGYPGNVTRAVVSDSVISGGGLGISAATAEAGADARVTVSRCTIQDTGTALNSYAPLGSAAIAVSYSLIANNNEAWHQQGTAAVIRTLGNNHMTDNAWSFGTLTSETPR